MKEEFLIQNAIEIYKTTIDHQNFIFNGFLTVVGIIIAIVLFVNWVLIC